MFKNAQRVPFLWWIVVVWVAMTVGGVAGGSIWGLGLHCEVRVADGEFPCLEQVDPNAAELVSSAFAGALRMGIGYGVVAGAPAIIFAAAVTVFGWLFSRVVDRRSALWPWMALAVGTGAVAVKLAGSEQAGNLYGWVHLSAFAAVAGFAIRQTYRHWTPADSNLAPST